MRGFAQNLGRGLNSMVQHSQKIASQGENHSGQNEVAHEKPLICKSFDKSIGCNHRFIKIVIYLIDLNGKTVYEKK